MKMTNGMMLNSVFSGGAESRSGAGFWSAVHATEGFADVPADGRQISLRV